MYALIEEDADIYDTDYISLLETDNESDAYDRIFGNADNEF
jgi:hypothetical protein